MSTMPSLGGSSKSRSAAVLIAVLAVGSAVGGGFFIKRLRTPAPPPPAPMVAQPARPEMPAPRQPSPLEKAGLKEVSVVVSGPLETAFVKQLGRPLGLPLTQVVVRSLVWWVEIPGDLRKGDTVDVLFEERPGEEPLVHAVRFKSEKMAKTFRAYRYKPEGARFARDYQPGGDELETRLEDAPLDDYEQVTSLLRDGRGHKGVDFKTPVGSPVKAPFDAVVQRKNWNFKMNGNSLEIKELGGGKTAMFLHLSEVPAGIHVGDKVSRGAVVAMSGNTGHSFAPHLHYQLMSGNTVLDPFAVHKTVRRSLPASSKEAFDGEVKRLDSLIDVALSGS